MIVGIAFNVFALGASAFILLMPFLGMVRP